MRKTRAELEEQVKALSYVIRFRCAIDGCRLHKGKCIYCLEKPKILNNDFSVADYLNNLKAKTNEPKRI